MINEYDIGDEIIFIARFKNRLGVATNPIAVEGGVRKPDDTVVVLVFANTGTVGEYEASYKPTSDGKHWMRVQGVGTVDTAEERAFRVRKERVNIP